MTPRRFARLRAVLARRQPDLTVLLEDVHKPHNLSAIVRTADAVGVHRVHAVVPGGGGLRAAEAVAQGTGKWLEIACHASLDEAFAALRPKGFRVWAAHPASRARDYREVDYTGPTAVLFGQEKEGVTAEAAERADGLLAVPMAGMVASLNVSVAAALVLYEARRQREAAGLYEGGPRLDPETFERTLFEWAYPKLADLCRRRGTAYPRLGDDGEILDPVPR